LDWHGCLDAPPDENQPIHPSNVQAVRRLYEAGYSPWICSYIGVGGPFSASRRAAVLGARRFLAGALGLGPNIPPGPSRAGIFLVITTAPTGPGGKVEALQRYSCELLVDDRQTVARSCEDAGIEVFRVKTPRCWREAQNEWYPSDFSEAETFVDAVDALIAENQFRRHRLSH